MGFLRNSPQLQLYRDLRAGIPGGMRRLARPEILTVTYARAMPPRSGGPEVPTTHKGGKGFSVKDV